MSYIVAIESVKQHMSRPLVLQSICVALAVLIVWEIITGFGLLSTLNQEVELNTNHTQNKVTDSGVSLSAKHSLFGDYVPSNLDDAGVRQSMLNIKVVGVLVAVNENDSQVILQNQGGQESFFRVGDELPGGGVIKRITSEGVLVLREGELERLSLSKEELNFEALSKPMPLENKKTGF